MTIFLNPIVIVILTVLGVTCVVAGGCIKDMGPCKPVNRVLKSFDFHELAFTNNGKWYYQMVPDEAFFDNIKYAAVQYKFVSPGLLDVSIYNILKNGSQQSFSSGRLAYQGNGHAVSLSSTATTSRNYEYKYYYLAQGRNYVYYIVCSDEGGNTKLDYRNVIVTEQLSDAELNIILKYHSEFIGCLRKLEVPY